MTVTDHISETDMQAFCSGVLPAADAILCAEHLEICPECSRVFERISSSIAASKIAGKHFRPETFIVGKHPDYETIGDYLDKKLSWSELESIKLHLEICRECSQEVESLREFRQSLEKELSSDRPRRGFIGKLISILRKPRFPNPVYVFGVVSVLILLSLMTTMIYRQRSRDLNEPHHAMTTPPSFIIDRGRPQPSSSPMPVRPVKVDRRNAGNVTSDKTEIIYDNGKRFIISYEGASIRIGNLAPELREDAAKVLQGRSIVDPAFLEDVTQPDANVRGTGEKNKVHLLSPLGTLIVEDRPVLKWKPAEGANGYVVDIVDERFNPIAQSPRLESTEWQVDESLKRDAIYQWQVTAFKGEERIDDRLNQVGKFKVVSERKVDELRRARKKYTTSFELLIFYLREGFIEEAVKELQEIRARNPDSRLVDKISPAN
jgi:hypothetical protein